MCGHEALVHLLCQHGADASIADANGETPLQVAASDAIKAAMTA
jgi:ankyrin repeat protein